MSQSTAVAERRMTPVQQVCTQLVRPEFKENLRQALPPNVSLDRFIRTALTGIQQNPGVCEADRQSLYLAIQRCAADGLMPDGREAALAIYGGKVNYMPMVLGIIKRLAVAGITIDAQVVREHDEFEQAFGDEAHITHRAPKLGQPRGALIGVYAIAKLPNGMVMREVMDKDQIDQVRKASRSSNGGPWKDWYDEMARKTVIRRLAKRLPILDPAVAETVAADDDLYDFAAGNAQDGDSAPPEAAPARPAGPRRPRGLEAVAAAGAASQPAGDGDVIDGTAERVDDAPSEAGDTQPPDDRPPANPDF
jgi:recombination protein RecT